jgi:heptosyltransferase-2
MIVRTPTIRYDCRHYRGDRPCTHNRLCDGCGQYEPYSHNLCVIKLGALGDVIRTLCILPELRKRYPQGRITWVTLPRAARLLAGHRAIDRIVTFDAMATLRLQAERFDLLVSLDKEAEPCALAMTLTSDDKRGIGLSSLGTPAALNQEAVRYMELGLSDDLKFRLSRNSYPKLVYEALGWVYRGQRYELPLTPQLLAAGRESLTRLGWSPRRPTVGVNVGAGSVFANKMWPAKRLGEVIAMIRKDRPDVQVLLLGGAKEKPIMDRLLGQHPWAIHTGHDNDEMSFVALVDACDVLFTGDTMAMHAAIARRRRVVVFFGPTCEQEIDLFGLGEKLIARTPCGPCYKRVCDQADRCLEAITARHACAAILRQVDVARGRELPLPVVAEVDGRAFGNVAA